MPTETQIAAWCLQNWPSVLFGLTAAFIYVRANSRLQIFLDRQSSGEKELLRQAHELLLVKVKLGQLVLTHCRKYPDEMEKLMKIDEDDDRP